MSLINKRRLCLAAIGLCSLGAASAAQAAGSQVDAGQGTLLTIVATEVPSPTAPLIWVLYVADAQLPGLLARGQPYRHGLAASTGHTTPITVGRVPVGSYFVIVGQDINGDEDIDSLAEPRGYSGYDGCLIPNWEKGAQAVHGAQMSIDVVLLCNRSRAKARE